VLWMHVHMMVVLLRCAPAVRCCKARCSLLADVAQAAAGAKSTVQRMVSWAASTLSGSDSDTEDAPAAPEASSQDAAKPQEAQAAAAPEQPDKPVPPPSPMEARMEAKKQEEAAAAAAASAPAKVVGVLL
jgi:hypothetical protein